jgi:2-polyprenyl-6-methoxyphenol hydroxylase-like FAD-dependent oxidoreductase
MRAIVVGGGIGGLTTALMLHSRGIHAQISNRLNGDYDKRAATAVKDTP